MLHQQTEGQNPQESTRSLWRDKIFRTFWAGQSVSVLGTQITDFALPVLAVTALNANAGDLALLRAMETLPFLALTLPVGLWLDRNAPRPAMLVANLVRAVLIGGVAVAGLLDSLRIGALAAALLIIGAATVVFDVAYMSYLLYLCARTSSSRATANSLSAMLRPEWAALDSPVAWSSSSRHRPP